MKNWRDVVKSHCDAATNGQAIVSNQLDVDGRYHITTGSHFANNHLRARTEEGVDLLLEEFCIPNNGWRKL